MNSSVRARARSFNLAAVLWRTESGECVRTRFEGLNPRPSSNAVGEVFSSSIKSRTQVSQWIYALHESYPFSASSSKEGQQFAMAPWGAWCFACHRRVMGPGHQLVQFLQLVRVACPFSFRERAGQAHASAELAAVCWNLRVSLPRLHRRQSRPHERHVSAFLANAHSPPQNLKWA